MLSVSYCSIGVPVVKAVAKDDDVNLMTMMCRRPYVPQNLAPAASAEQKAKLVLHRMCAYY